MSKTYLVNLESSVLPQTSTAPDGVVPGTIPVAAGAEATSTKPQTIAAATNKTSVAPATEVPATTIFNDHTPEGLHLAILEAKEAFEAAREQADAYAYEKLLPALDEAIRRYRQPGKGAAFRMNNCPTVEEYFESIGLNYDTVRSWKLRSKERLLKTATDAGTRRGPQKLDFRKATTPDGHPTSEAVSALHKSIRRGDEKLAAYFARELDLAGFPGAAWNRVKITVAEDVSPTVSGLASDIKALYSLWKECSGKDDLSSDEDKPKTKRLFLVRAIQLVCRAPKNRIGDHLTIVTYEGGQKFEVPDYALDIHTLRGRNRGRGVEHFWQEGAKVENHDGQADPYNDEAFRIRKEAKAAQKEQKKTSRKTK